MKKNIIRTAALAALLLVGGLSASAQQKSYNVPELTRDAVRTTAKQLKECIYRDEDTQKVKYVK